MKSTDFKDLVVWQKAMEIARDIYVLVRELPKEETYGLSDQMRRCAVSIPSNIAEGQQRNSAKEFQHFINIAQGSRGELETQLLLAKDIGYLSESAIEPTYYKLDEINKMLYALSKSITNAANAKCSYTTTEN